MAFPTKKGYEPVAGEDIEMRSDSLNANGATNNKEKNCCSYFLGGLILIACVAVIGLVVNNVHPPLATKLEGEEKFDKLGRYLMKDFDTRKPMSDFLNGLGGVWGIPMWSFYVNRGQGIASFGTQNKDGSIYKFNTAEKAYQQTPFTGFRTFLKGKRGAKTFHHMPFFPATMEERENLGIVRDMMIGSSEMEIREESKKLGLKTNVLYFTTVDQDFPALIRRVTFKNTDPSTPLELEVLDGLAKLIPAGLGNWALDSMGRTVEAWMNVFNVGKAASEGDIITQPFYHISQDIGDTSTVKVIKDGNFALSFLEGVDAPTGDDGSYELLPFVVDPSIVFGTDTTLFEPTEFWKSTESIGDFVKNQQCTTGRTPTAFTGTKINIPAGGSITITSVYGHTKNLEYFTDKATDVIRKPGFIDEMRQKSLDLVKSITDKVGTRSGLPLFDAYVRQDFLDNVLRGGIPISLGSADKPKVFHVFSRIHGDIERDYNNFQIDTTYFSQGPGNFRDVCQNRRLDLFHSPSIGNFNVRMFLSFIQSDGYNPLTVASTNFVIREDKISRVLKDLAVVQKLGTEVTFVKSLLQQAFRPGQFFADVAAANIKFDIDEEDVLSIITNAAEQEFAAAFAQNGYWADHWTYIMDLLYDFLSIYPDKEETLLWFSEPVPFYMSPAVVKPRQSRYNVVPDASGSGASKVRVLSAISTWDELSPERRAEMNAIYNDQSFVRDKAGAGGFWQRDSAGKVAKVSVIAKLLMLGLTKFATMDPFGMGVEMEGGKPGWNDAMNGLPGLLGSGMPETYEMLVIINYVKSALDKFGKSIVFPSEFVELMYAVDDALIKYSRSQKGEEDMFLYWEKTNLARENYRKSTEIVFSGNMTAIPSIDLSKLLRRVQTKVEEGIERSLKITDNVSPTYFFYECTDFNSTSTAGKGIVHAKKFEVRQLPLFLEGPTRHLKILTDQEHRREVYWRTKNSDLYDSKLQMFAISASLSEMGQEVGRMKAFNPGWLENQSIWLHMSYKFYLELLRAGLYDEFFDEIKTGLVPFMDDEIYGRSPLEASSFIVSSVFPDPKLHGTGFLPRLSGSTAELLSMWAIMMAGPKPFQLDKNGDLTLNLTPILPGWMFHIDKTVSFTFLGSINVTYYNPNLYDTWTVQSKKISYTNIDGTKMEIEGSTFDRDTAKSVRELQVSAIFLEF